MVLWSILRFVIAEQQQHAQSDVAIPMMEQTEAVYWELKHFNAVPAEVFRFEVIFYVNVIFLMCSKRIIPSRFVQAIKITSYILYNWSIVILFIWLHASLSTACILNVSNYISPLGTTLHTCNDYPFPTVIAVAEFDGFNLFLSVFICF